VYEHYRARVQLKCIVDSGASFPISQGDSLVGSSGIVLTVTYT